MSANEHRQWAFPDGPWSCEPGGRTIYIGSPGSAVDVGRMDSPYLAAHVVACVNFRQEVDGQLAGAGGRLTEPVSWDTPVTLSERADRVATAVLRRWGSAADTVCEHATEAEARLHEANTTTVHRWPDGPWLTDDGRIWAGDDQFAAIQGQVFELVNQADWYKRRSKILRDAAYAVVEDRNASPSGYWLARAALDAELEVANEPERLREALESLPKSPAEEAS